MKVAISTDGEYVSEHFGRCPKFTLLNIENGKANSIIELDNPGHSPGNIPRVLHDKGVELIICGGMGARAEGFFKQFGIKSLTGIRGKIEEVILKLENGTLEGGESFCTPGAGKDYGIDKTVCDHSKD